MINLFISLIIYSYPVIEVSNRSCRAVPAQPIYFRAFRTSCRAFLIKPKSGTAHSCPVPCFFVCVKNLKSFKICSHYYFNLLNAIFLFLQILLFFLVISLLLLKYRNKFDRESHFIDNKNLEYNCKYKNRNVKVND